MSATTGPVSARVRWAVVGLTLVVVSLPFWVVTFPPCTDLPQHVAQIRLLTEALAGAPEYRINWFAPNNLVYLLLGGLWTFLSPLLVARTGLLILACAWAGSIGWLAARRQRPWESAALAAALVFQTSLYWGFLNFLIGWPFFVVWLALTADAGPPRRWGLHAGALAAVAVLLYASHVLWFGMALVWLLLIGALTRPSRRMWAVRAAAVALPALGVLVWFGGFKAGRVSFDLSPHWVTPPWQRLLPIWLGTATLDGRPGSLMQAMMVGLLIAWAWSAAKVARRSARGSAPIPIDRPLLAAAAMMLGFALLAPDQYMNTIYLGSRWIPAAVALLLLGLPAPARSRRLRALVAFGALASWSLTTAKAWTTFERQELSGLVEAIDAASPGARVLGLDFVTESRLVTGRPFMQVPAYLQAVHGGTLNFSFAEHASSIVSYRQPRRLDWTPGLEWWPGRFRAGDLLPFDLVLINGAAEVHQRFAAMPALRPLTFSGRWRLYRVLGPS